MEPQKPAFLIIGSAKCGTTALASILGSHPDCCMSNPKEVSFFQDTIDFKPNPNYEKGWEWYKKAFAHYTGESVVGEATPSYSDRSRSPNTAKRIYEFNPDMKIIYMVRNPFKRQISGWKMQYASGKEKSFPWRREHKWALKGFDYWMRMQGDVGQWDECRYSYQLCAYEEFFSNENICVSFLEDWQHSKEAEVKRIMMFLGLNPASWQTNSPEQANRASDRTIETPLVKKIRRIPQFQAIFKSFPSSWQNWATMKFARTKVVTPVVEISPNTQQSFINYVADDSRAFLQKYGKNLELWSESTFKVQNR